MWIALALNVVGGILAGLIVALWGELRKRLKSRQFKQVFGPAVSEHGFALVYEEMVLHDSTDGFPYSKPDGNQMFRFSISRPIPIASVRSVNYLSSAIGTLGGRTPILRSDIETQTLLDIDFICFGGPQSNLMTASTQGNRGNKLATFGQASNKVLSLRDNSTLATAESQFDYGLILKVRPTQFPERVWISCAGFGEWGTSGAAWFLAHKWEEIRRTAKAKPFAAVVQVSPGKDQSAQLAHLLT